MLIATSLLMVDLPSASADPVPASYEVTLIDQDYSILGAIPENIILGNNQEYNTNATLAYNSSARAIEYTTVGDQVGSMYVGIEPFINGNLTIRMRVDSDNWNSNVYIIGSTFWIQTQTLSDGGARVTSLYDTSPTSYASSHYDVPVTALTNGVNTIHIAVSGTSKSLRVYYNDTLGVDTPLSDWSVQTLPYEPMTLPILKFNNERSGYATWTSTQLYGIKETVSGGVVSAIPGNDFVPFGIDYPRDSYNALGIQHMIEQGHKGVAWADLQWLEYQPQQIAFIKSLLNSGWELGIHYNKSLNDHPLDEALTIMQDQYDNITAMLGQAPTSWCSYANADNTTHAAFAYEHLGMIWRNGYSGVAYLANIGNLQETRWPEFWSQVSNAQMVYPSFTHKTDEAVAEEYAIGQANFTEWVDNYDGKRIIGINEYYHRVANQVDTTINYLNYVPGENLKFSVQCNAFQTRLVIDFPSAGNAVVLKNDMMLIEGSGYAVVGSDSIVLFGSSNDVFEITAISGPSAPKNLNAIAGNAQVTLTWSAPVSDGGAPITGYKLYWSSERDGPFSSVLVNTTSYLHEGLTSGMTYYYKVAAISSVGEGETSGVVSATPATPSSLPSAITDLVYNSRNGTVELSWSAPASDGGSPITGYMVYRGTTANDLVYIATVAETSFVDTSAQVGVQYVYGVYAVNGNGMGSSIVLVEAVVTNETTAASSVPLEYLAIVGVGLAAVAAGVGAFLWRRKTIP